MHTVCMGSDNLGDYLMKYAYCMYGRVIYMGDSLMILYVWGVIPGRLPNEICILYVWGIPNVTDF